MASINGGFRFSTTPLAAQSWPALQTSARPQVSLGATVPTASPQLGLASQTIFGSSTGLTASDVGPLLSSMNFGVSQSFLGSQTSQALGQYFQTAPTSSALFPSSSSGLGSLNLGAYGLGGSGSASLSTAGSGLTFGTASSLPTAYPYSISTGIPASWLAAEKPPALPSNPGSSVSSASLTGGSSTSMQTLEANLQAANSTGKALEEQLEQTAAADRAGSGVTASSTASPTTSASGSTGNALQAADAKLAALQNQTISLDKQAEAAGAAAAASTPTPSASSTSANTPASEAAFLAALEQQSMLEGDSSMEMSLLTNPAYKLTSSSTSTAV